MKFMTYNVRDGAQKTFDLIVSIVNSQQPDFLCLNEANGFDTNNNKRLQDFSALTGFKYFQLEKCGDGRDYHVAIFSKLPITNTRSLHPVSRAAILTTLETSLGKITVCSTHLSPYSEEKRLEEVNLILEALGSKDKSVIMGDLNSLSSDDTYMPNFVRSFNSGQIRKFTDGHKILFKVMDAFGAADYIDSSVQLNRQFDATVPTKVSTDVEHTEMRLDYILISSSLQDNLKDYSVIKNNTTNSASDHFPVVVEIG